MRKLFNISSVIRIMCVGFCITAFSTASAQGIGSEVVEVVKEYEATIQDAQKVTIPPDIPDIPEQSKTLEYLIPPKDFKDFTFEPNPLKPIAIRNELVPKYNSSYIKIGFGSQLMPLAQLAYNDNKAKNIKFGIFYNHLSAMGYKNKAQRFSDDEVGAYARFFPKTFEIGTAFTFHNYRTHFYGTDSNEKAKDIRQVFRNYDGLLYIRNAQKNKAEINFSQTLNFNFLTEKFDKSKEWFIAGNTDISKTVYKYHNIIGRFRFDVSDLKRDTSNLQRNLFTIGAGYGFNNDDWKANAVLGVQMDGKTPYFYADVHLEKKLYQNMLLAYIDYSHQRVKNSLNSLAHTNNFIQSSLGINNTLNGDLGIGLKGTLTDFSYNLAFHFNHINNLPLFVNDTADMKRFVVVYDSNTVVYNFHFEAGYNVKEWLRISLVGDYNNYQLKDEARAWHEPAFRATLRANYIWKNKISVTMDLFGLTPAYAKLTDGRQVRLNGTADINLGVNYMFNKHISFFGTLNNIANIKYQRWYKYPTYGINGMLGAKFSF